MSEILERVAKAICKSRTCEGVSCCQWPSQGGRTQCPVRDGGYDDAARAAIWAAYDEAGITLEKHEGNKVYKAAWRTAAKMLRTAKY